MKKLSVCLATLFFSFLANAQDVKTVFDSEKIVFYGLDFTKAKFAIPDAKPDEIKADYFSAWNSTVFSDNGRFPKESAFGKITVYGDPTVVEKRNATTNTGNMTGQYNAPLSRSDIENVISEYKGGRKSEGLGVVFVVEYFSKKDKKGIADVVFFDIATRKVLLSKQLTGEPRGGGLNSYWMGAIQQMFEKMTNTEYALWKKEAAGK